MFERYTEQARRTIFFARYEASRLHTARIEPIHLLLACSVRTRCSANCSRRRCANRSSAISRKTPIGTEKVPASVDLPLTTESKRVLDVAAEEAGNQRGVPSILRISSWVCSASAARPSTIYCAPAV